MKKKDAELIQRTLDGDQSAFTALVEKYQKGVHALAWQKIGDFHIAQEITQDAFLRAYQKLGTLKNHNLFSGWLYVIATRLCCEWLRKKRLPMQSLETVDTKEVDQVAYKRYVEEQRETDINEIRRELVRDLLKKLPESERTVMTLHYLGEMTCESISEFLGVSPNTIRSRLSRARNRLKKEETMIKENLSSFQLPTQMTENIMKEISRLNPITSSGSKPLVPLAVSAASAVLVLLLMGLGTQRLSDFQKPYNLNAQSERTIEISEAQLVIDSPAKPAVRNKVGDMDLTGESNGVGQKPDDPLFAAANLDETEVSKAKSEWVQTKGPEGGSVSGLFTTTRGDVYAGTRQGLYRLTDDGTAWRLINNMEGPSHVSLTIKSKWWPVVERQDTLYLATINHILASTDRGETWQTLCESIEGPLVDMVITDGIPGAQSDMTIYLAHTNGVFRTDDAGKSWTPLSEGLIGRKVREIAAVDNTIFVGTDQGLLRLNDEKWEHLPIGKPDKNSKTQAILDLAADEHHLYVVVGEEMKHQIGEGYTIMMLGDPGWLLYRSIDTGNSWALIDPRTDGFEDKFRNRTPGVRITAMGEKILVTAGKDHFYSSDAGGNWTLLDLGHLSEMYNNSDALLYDANTIYKGGMHGIHRTTDSGKSWHQFNTGLIGTHVRDLISVNNTLYVYAAERGLVSSSDSGESWTLVTTDTFGEQLMVGFDDILYTTASNSNLMNPRRTRSSDLRLMRFSEQDKKLTFIQGMPDLRKINSFDDGWIRLNKPLEPVSDTKTENLNEDLPSAPKKSGGITFDSYSWIEIKTRVKIASFAISDTAYYVEFQHQLFRWKPGTSEWYDTGLIDEEARDKFKNSEDLADTSIFKLAVSGDTVYVGKRDGRLMQSFDEGDTWNDVTANLPFSVDRFHAIAFAGKSVYVATDKGVVRSSNGTDWHILTDVEGTPLVMGQFAVAGTTVYGESEQKIYQLDGNTNMWQQVTPEIPYPVTCLDVDGNMIYVGTFGRGVLRFTLDE